MDALGLRFGVMIVLKAPGIPHPAAGTACAGLVGWQNGTCIFSSAPD